AQPLCVDDRPVTQDDAVADGTTLVRRSMYDYSFLDRCFVAYLDGAVVAPQYGPMADIAALADSHVAYDNCRLAHVRADPHNRLPSVKPVKHSCYPPGPVCPICASINHNVGIPDVVY